MALHVQAWFSFPDGLPREVIDDRMRLLAQGTLTYRDIDAVMDSWDTSSVPRARDTVTA